MQKLTFKKLGFLLSAFAMAVPFNRSLEPLNLNRKFSGDSALPQIITQSLAPKALSKRSN